jgi:hypothetical protein
MGLSRLRSVKTPNIRYCKQLLEAYEPLRYEPFRKGKGILFMSYKQKITHYLQNHRLVSIITGRIVVIAICTVALFGNFLSSQTSVFADASPTTIINEVFGADAPAALRIAMCESSLNPNAVNSTPIGGSHARGLFQILYPSTWNTTSQAGNSPFDARANTIAAHEIFIRDGHSWREWACQP